MNKFFSIPLIALAFASCAQTEDVRPAMGTVSVALSKQAESPELITRTVDDDLQVDILNSEGTLVKHFAEGEAHSGIQALELEAGTYSLEAYTANHRTTFPDTERGAAKYFGRTDFTVVAGKEARVGLRVPMINMAVSLQLPADIADRFTGIRFALIRGDRTQELSSGETAYFDLTPAADLTYSLTMTNADGETGSKSAVLPVERQKAGTHYTITYAMGQLGLR